MLSPQELKKIQHYSAIIAAAGGDVTVLTAEESRELAALVDKAIGQQESHSPKRSALPEPYQKIARIELRKMPSWKLKEVYENLKAGEITGIEPVEQNRAYAISAIEEILWERGKLGEGEKFLPMSPEEGPPLPRGLELRWPWKKD